MSRFGLIRSALAAALAIAVAVAGNAGAAPLPSNGSIAFKVFMDGEEVGSHTLDFSEDGDRLKVDIKIDFTVRFLNIPVYRYEHRNLETWSRDGTLLALESRTDDDGDVDSAKIRRLQDRLEIKGSRNSAEVPALWHSSSYWNAALVKQTKLIDSRNGQIFNISVTPVSQDVVQVGDARVPATRYDIAGDLALSVWYDASGEWVKMGFDHRGRRFDYQRITPKVITSAAR